MTLPDDVATATLGLAPAEPPIVIEHREQLIYLLRQAAELEHAILCGYLYTAFSLKQSEAEGLTAGQVDAVSRWGKVVFTVARQEMLHLAVVQNLLTSIGAAPHLARPNLPTPPGHFPPGVRVGLLPFGEPALRHFLHLERPEGMPLDDVEAASALAEARPLVDERDIVPRSQPYATVGHLYRAIDIGFSWLTHKLGEDGLFIGPREAQAGPEQLGWPELVLVGDLDSAHRAIDVVVEQGEGARGEWRTAHFGRFLDVLAEYCAARAGDPSFEPARPILAPGVHRDDAWPRISDTTSADVDDLFNVANQILLLALARFFAHTDETPQQLMVLVEVAVGMMFDTIKPLGQRLTALPFGPTHPGRSAAPSFEVFYQSGYLLPHRTAAWYVIAERLREAAEFAERIEDRSHVGIGAVAAALRKHAAAVAAGLL